MSRHYVVVIRARKTARLIRSLAEAAEAQGWVITLRSNNHLLWTSPKGAKVFTSQTPTDHRAVHRIRADLRRNGFDG